MAFVNRLGLLVPSMGTPHANDALFLSQANALTGAGTATINMTGLTPTVSKGYVRVKLSGLAATATLVLVKIQLTDGTNTEIIYLQNPTTALAFTTTTQFDVVVAFEVDINANQCTVVVTEGGSGAAGIADIEVAGTI